MEEGRRRSRAVVLVHILVVVPSHRRLIRYPVSSSHLSARPRRLIVSSSAFPYRAPFSPARCYLSSFSFLDCPSRLSSRPSSRLSPRCCSPFRPSSCFLIRRLVLPPRSLDTKGRGVFSFDGGQLSKQGANGHGARHGRRRGEQSRRGGQRRRARRGVGDRRRAGEAGGYGDAPLTRHGGAGCGGVSCFSWIGGGVFLFPVPFSIPLSCLVALDGAVCVPAHRRKIQSEGQDGHGTRGKTDAHEGRSNQNSRNRHGIKSHLVSHHRRKPF